MPKKNKTQTRQCFAEAGSLDAQLLGRVSGSGDVKRSQSEEHLKTRYKEAPTVALNCHDTLQTSWQPWLSRKAPRDHSTRCHAQPWLLSKEGAGRDL